MALEMCGAEHLLWALHYPANKDIQGALQVIEELDISDSDKERVVGKNLESMLGLQLAVV